MKSDRKNAFARTASIFALVAGLAGATAASAATGGSLGWPSAEDKAICDSVFASLRRHEQGIQVAQAGGVGVADALAAVEAIGQACSYEGKALRIDASLLTDTEGELGAAAVKSVMRFTGLPQNFKVIEGKVPNAAAMVVIGPDRVPQRIIAYNPAFMSRVSAATENSDWPALSIMAHEIGHHLSGHTLTPGGSQPPTELEADKFSGFVLYKMGATLDDAQTAISTLIPEADGPTHPGRAKRLVAVKDGWTESCAQQDGECDAATVVAAAPTAKRVEALPKAAGTAPVPPPMQPATGPKVAEAAPVEPPDTQVPDAPLTTPQPAVLDRIPKLDTAATPSKFDRFVYDEVGVFDADDKEALAKMAFDYAASNNVEIVTVIAGDLQGRSADQYALDVMRQLRVGKLEVGNGAVLVVAPEAKETGVALGAGLLVEYEDTDSLRGYLQSYLDLVANKTKPSAAAELIGEATDRIVRDTKSWEWTVKFQSLQEMLDTAEQARAELERTGAKYDPNTDPTWRKLVRITATVVTKSPDPNDKQLDVNDMKEQNIGPAMHVRTPEGVDAMLYVHPSVPALMPVALEEGRSYAFVARESFLAGDTPQFDLVSYDLVD